MTETVNILKNVNKKFGNFVAAKFIKKQSLNLIFSN